MANKRDIMGLLTGIPREGISPLSQLTPHQMRAQAVQGGIEAMGRGMRGLMTGERRTPQQVQQANLRKLMSNIDLNSPEGLMKLAEIQKAQRDLSGAADTIAKAQKLTNIANRKESLLKVAREQGNELIEEYILSAGDTDAALNKIQEVLFRRDPTFKTSGAPTKADITLYEKLLEQYTDKELEDLNIPTEFSFLTFGGGVDEADKLIIINNAKEIATNFPKLGKKAALAEALRQYGISKSAESMPTDTNVVESSSRMTGAKIK
jgi:hypothetical protein